MSYSGVELHVNSLTNAVDLEQERHGTVHRSVLIFSQKRNAQFSLLTYLKYHDVFISECILLYFSALVPLLMVYFDLFLASMLMPTLFMC